ncbi:MAG: 6-phosphogluconolactonase [Longicatena sp.]
MQIIHSDTYEQMSIQGCDLLLDTIQKKNDAVICLATGSTPKRMYELLVHKINEQRIDLTNVTFVKLDEWYGLEPDHPSTCHTFIKQHLLDKLYMKPKCLIEFTSNAVDVTQELIKVETYLKEHPIDVMILGLGMNAHLGLNEPSQQLTLGCHQVMLNSKTKTHDMIKGEHVESGMTIGMDGIFKSKQVLMLVSGSSKEDAYKDFMSGTITTQVPASMLWLHTNCVCLVDTSQFK